MKRTPRTRRKPKYPSAADQARREWSAEFDRCFVCRCQPYYPPLQTHEIARKSKTSQWRNEASYVRTCQMCHDGILSWAPPDLQLAIKWLGDETNFDLAVVNQLRRRAVDAVSWGDVKKWIEVIQSLRGER